MAVIGAVATLGAALISSLHGSKPQPASVEQTSSGDGAINVGHDAVINNTPKSASEEAAERVQACEEHHGMKRWPSQWQTRPLSFPESTHSSWSARYFVPVRELV